jgi:hypothetical protein
MNTRHSPGAGSIYQRNDGIWTAVIAVRCSNGNRRRKAMYGKTRTEVVAKLQAAQRQQEGGLG